MRKSFKYMILAALLAAVSCEQMNLPTKDKVSDDDIFSSASSLRISSIWPNGVWNTTPGWDPSAWKGPERP